MLYCYTPTNQRYSSVDINYAIDDESSISTVYDYRSLANKSIKKPVEEMIPLGNDLENSLFKNKSDVKIMISQIAMHLSDKKRYDLFKQIDSLLDLDSFCDGDNLIILKSFSTFLKFYTLYSNTKRPALTVTNNGTLGSTWVSETGKLYIESLANKNNEFVAAVSRKYGNEVEYISYKGTLKMLKNFLKQNNINSWFLNDKQEIL